MLTGDNLVEAAGIMFVIVIVLLCAGAIAVNRARQDGDW